MKRIIITVFLIALLSGCTTYEGAAYIKDDLNRMECSNNPAQGVKTACINDIVDEEYFKGGAAYVTVDSIKEIDRWKYANCMGDKGFSCTWGPSGTGPK